MLNGFRSFGSHCLLLLRGEGWEVGRGVINKKAVRTSHQFAAVQTISFSLLCANDLPTVEAIINKFVFLRHTVALDPLKVDLFRSGFLLFHSL